MNLPNLITLGRIALVPVIVVLLLDEGRLAGAAAALLFLVASVSDWLDGYLARRYDLTTNLGKFLDPVADKLLVSGALIMLAGMSREPAVPAILVVVVIGRELVVTGLRAIASGEGIILPAEELGKYKTLFQVIALHGLLIHYRYWGVDFHLAGMYFLWISVFVSLWSGAAYTMKVSRLLRDGRTAGAGSA